MNRFASLIDFENLAHDNRHPLGPDAAARRLSRVRSLTDHGPATLAIQTALASRYLPSLAGPWQLRFVSSTPNAADLVLLDAAHACVDSGITDLVVVSGDGVFQVLRHRARLHVVTLRDRLSRALAGAAETVTFLDDPVELRAA